MATRFYLSSTGAPAIDPAIDPAWSNGAGALRPCSTSPTGSAMAGASGSYEGSPVNLNVARFVSLPLAAQEVSGTVKGQMMAAEDDSDIDAMAQLVIRVLASDGVTVRGTLLAAHAEALSSEFNAPALRNRKFPLAALSPASLSPVAAQAGDRLVFEVGFRAVGASTGDATARIGDNGAGDLPEDETGTDATLNPWIEMSQDLTFQAPAPAAAGAGGLGLGLRLGL